MLSNKSKLSAQVLVLIASCASAPLISTNSSAKKKAMRWWIKDGGRDCRLTKGQKNGCYGQVERRDQESALACWGLDQ